MAKLHDDVLKSMRAFGSYIVSTATLNPDHLVPSFLSILEPGTDDVQEILYDRSLSQNDICNYLWDLIEKIDIEGYWFGGHDDDPACIGWWKIYDDEAAEDE